LRDTIVEVSIRKHPRYLSEPKINAIKDGLISALRLNEESSKLDEDYTCDVIKKILDEQISLGFNHWAIASSVFTGQGMEYQAHRGSEIMKNFSILERNELSKLIIRKFDRKNNYHCNVKHCGEKCLFARESCKNANCGVIYSRKWAQKHDAICPEKLIECDRLCGELVVRKNMATHLEVSCTLRPITCPFAGFGCSSGSFLYFAMIFF